MRKIMFSSKFKTDVKKKIEFTLTKEWFEVINSLSNDLVLPEKYCDHQLKGELKDNRECHIKPDLLLIYAKFNDEKTNNPVLQLIRLGTHSELFKK